MSVPVIIGVDGGNSKTDVVLASLDGRVLASVRGPGSSPHQLGLDAALGVVDTLIAEAWEALPGGPRGIRQAREVAVFMAGADLPHEEAALGHAVARRSWADHSEASNDVFALVWAGTGTAFGVAVTVGAGVNCAGRAPSGRVARFPALGAITGDWGGGEEIGMVALGAAVRADDGRGEPTVLTRLITDYFGCATALEVAVAIHEDRLDGGRLVELPPLVVDAARQGDRAARAIIDRQADEVVCLAVAGLRQMAMTEMEVAVVLGGSFLVASAPIALDRITAGVTSAAPRARVQLCTLAPVAGAALAALAAAGAPDGAAARLRGEMAPVPVLPGG